MNAPTAAARAGGRAWIAGVAVILGATVAVNIHVFRLANADPSFAVEQDYYGKALRWDDELAQRERNAMLGWTASLALSPDGSEGTMVRVRLADAGGAPLRDARVRVSAFSVARSARVLEATLVAEGDGEYAAPLPVTRGGMWELRVEAVRGADRFTSTHRLDLVASAAGRVR